MKDDFACVPVRELIGRFAGGALAAFEMGCLW
jgi:hypothetical protein